MITVKSAQFLYSRTSKQETDLCEVCFCGRSNAGKSSLINMLAGQKHLAKTSSEPGRTRLINYFEFILHNSDTNQTKKLLFVDLPGYGYARVEKTKKEQWDNMIDDYIQNSQNLSLCVSIVDSRIPPQPNDIQLINYLYKLMTPFVVVAAKVDKLKNSQKAKSIQTITNTLKLGKDNIILSSTIDQTGKQFILQKLYDTVGLYETFNQQQTNYNDNESK